MIILSLYEGLINEVTTTQWYRRTDSHDYTPEGMKFSDGLPMRSDQC